MINWLKKINFFENKKGSDFSKEDLTSDEILHKLRKEASNLSRPGMIIIIQQCYLLEIYIVEGTSLCFWGFKSDFSRELFLERKNNISFRGWGASK